MAENADNQWSNEVFLHGIPELFRARSKMCKWMWLFIVIASGFGMLMIVKRSLTQFAAQTVRTEVKIQRPLTIPKILFCPINWVDPLKLDLMGLSENDIQFAYAIPMLSRPVSEINQTVNSSMLPHGLQNLSIDEIVSKLRIDPCYAKLWFALEGSQFRKLDKTAVATSNGPCIHLQNTNPLTKVGVQYVRVRLEIDSGVHMTQKCNIGQRINGNKKVYNGNKAVYNESNGVALLANLHFGDDADSLLPLNGIEVRHGRKYTILVEKISAIRLNTHMTPCLKWNHFSWSSCILECVNLKLCNATCQIYHPNTNQTLKQLCMTDNAKKWEKHSCFESIFGSKFEQYCGGACPQPCESISYKSLTTTEKTHSQLIDIYVQFKNALESWAIIESQEVQSNVLIGRIGGAAEMFLSFTLMSIFQVIYFIARKLNPQPHSFKLASRFSETTLHLISRLDFYGVRYLVKPRSKFDFFYWLITIVITTLLMFSEVIPVLLLYYRGQTTASLSLIAEQQPITFMYCPYWMHEARFRQHVGSVAADRMEPDILDFTNDIIPCKFGPDMILCVQSTYFLHSIMAGSFYQILDLEFTNISKAREKNSIQKLSTLAKLVALSGKTLDDFLENIAYKSEEVIDSIQIGQHNMPISSVQRQLRSNGVCYLLTINYTASQLIHDKLAKDHVSVNLRTVGNRHFVSAFYISNDLSEAPSDGIVIPRSRSVLYDITVREKYLKHASTSQHPCMVSITKQDRERCIFRCITEPVPGCCKAYAPRLMKAPIENISEICSFYFNPFTKNCIISEYMSKRRFLQCEHICHDPCSSVSTQLSINQFVSMEDTDNPENNWDEILQYNVTVNIHRSSGQQILVEEYISYDGYTLVSSLGGICSLYFGFSLLTIAQALLIPVIVKIEPIGITKPRN